MNGTAAANECAAAADLVVCVGTRLTDFTTASLSLFAQENVRFLSINVNPADAVRLGGAPVVADARLALEALLASTSQTRVDEVPDEHDKTTSASDEDGQLDRWAVYRAVNAAARPGDRVVAAAGWHRVTTFLRQYTTPQGSHAHLEFGFSCMGHEVPAGLGIRLHEGPTGEIVVIGGDGSLLMSGSELLTAAQYGLKVTVVVIDNGGYGSIDALARSRTGISLANRFVTASGEALDVDYTALGRALNCHAIRADDAAALRDAR